jgi:hypothetical protein
MPVPIWEHHATFFHHKPFDASHCRGKPAFARNIVEQLNGGMVNASCFGEGIGPTPHGNKATDDLFRRHF